MLMIINYQTKEQAKLCDIFIEPHELANYKVFSISKAKEIYDIGYESAKNTFSKLAETHPLNAYSKSI